MPSVKDSLFGMLAVRSGYATEAQVQECIDVQEQYRRQGGKVPRLGELLAQKGVMTPAQVSSVLEGQHREKGGLFGEIAIRWKFVTREQVDEALKQQQEEHSTGTPRRKIGEILLYKGYLQVHQIAAILETQKRRVIQCSGCGKYLNIAGFRPGDKLKCAACSTVTEVPSMPGFTFTDFRPQEAEVVPADTREAAEQESGAGSGMRQAISGEGAAAATGEKQPLEIGGYEIITRIGQDATGTTVKARHIATDTTVILKVMKVTPMQDEAFLRRFIEEGKKGTQLIHKYIKRVYEVGLDKGRYYYSTEYIEGKSLKKVLDENKRFTALEAVDIIIKTAQALSYAHKNGVIHGDLRPSSIILSEDGGIKISDIGIAKDIAGNLRYFARSSQVVPFYVAPELVVDESSLSQASDVYSLGAILYHLITGKPPFEGENPLEVLMRISEGSAPSPYKLGMATEGLSKVIMKMIAPEPEERYRTVDDAIGDMREHLRDAALSTTKARKTEATQKTVARRTTSRVPNVEGQMPLRTTATMKKEKSGGGKWAVLMIILILGLGSGGYYYYINYINVGPNLMQPSTNPVTEVNIPVDNPAKLSLQAAEAYANSHADDPRGAYERYKTFLAQYPDVDGSIKARREMTKYKELAAKKHLTEMVQIRDEYLARDDYEGALQTIDRWLDEYSDTSEAGKARNLRESLLNDEQNFLVRKTSEGRVAADNKDTSVLESLKKYKPSTAMTTRRDEAIAELEKLFGVATTEPTPVTQPATPDQLLAPPSANNEPPKQPEVDEATATAAEAKELSAKLGKAVTAFDTEAVEEVSFVRTKYKPNAYIPEEAARLAGFLDTMAGRASRQTKSLEVTFRGAKQTVSSADKTGVVITITTGANKSDVQVPWGQIPSDTLWEIVKPLVKEDKDEHVNLGLMFFYREQPVYARWAWSHAMTLGADVKVYVDRLATTPAPKEGPSATPPSGEVKPPDKTMEVVPKKIVFEGDGVRNYVKNAKGTWQTGEKYMIVSGSASAELACGEVKGFSVRFRARETAVKAMFSLGLWKIGLDGNEGKAIVQHTDKTEKRVPETVSAGPEYTLSIEPSPDGRIFTVNGKVIDKSDDKKPQPGPLVIEVEGKMGIDLLEIRFEE